MKKSSVLILAMIVLLAVSFTGCTTSRNVGNAGATVELAPIEYEIVGNITVDGNLHNVLGLFSWGGPTYEELLKEAREMGGDDVINIYEDKTDSGFFPIYYQTKTVFNATVIKYLD